MKYRNRILSRIPGSPPPIGRHRKEENFMPSVLCVHGIAQQLKGENTLRSEWLPALNDGLARAEATPIDENDVAFAFYGDLFRGSGAKSIGEPQFTVSDIDSEYELAVLEAWWKRAAEIDPEVSPPDSETKARTPEWVQRALRGMVGSRFFSQPSDRLFIGNLKQVSAYFTDAEIRHKAVARVLSKLGPETRLVIGHSLGSVVAYEALFRNSHTARVPSFITLGSPLGMPNIIYDRIDPVPVDGRAFWPPDLKSWVNIADRGDVVAMVCELRTLFGDGTQIEDHVVDNESTAHDVKPYLTARVTGAAVASALGINPSAHAVQ